MGAGEHGILQPYTYAWTAAALAVLLRVKVKFVVFNRFYSLMGLLLLSIMLLKNLFPRH